MIRSTIANAMQTVPSTEQGRTVDPFTDPEMVRLAAINLELAVRNLMQSSCIPNSIILTADLVTHQLVAAPTSNGEVRVVVFTN
ncbi:MAG: hypothetical protein ACTSYL_09565 [Candidatus Thorarchaeota archaeon]